MDGVGGRAGMDRKFYDLNVTELGHEPWAAEYRGAPFILYGIFFFDRRRRTWSVIYIGQTQNMASRWSSHKAKARAGGLLPIIAKMHKHPPEDFRMVPITTAKTQKAATALEDWLMDREGTLVPNGCNVIKGTGPQRSAACSGYATDIWARDYFRSMRAALHDLRRTIIGWESARTARRRRILAASEVLIEAMLDDHWRKHAEAIVLPLRQHLAATAN